MSECTLACLDLGGTVVDDGDLVERSFGEAVATQGIVPGTAAYARAMAQIHRSRGMAKLDILRTVFPDDESRALAVNVAFERSLDAAIDRSGLAAHPGAEQVVDALTEAGVRVCLLTGFSRNTLGRILDTLGWWTRFDLALSPDDVAGRGRPWPDMILSAALRLRAEDVRQVVVVGDTDNDMLAGRRAGAGSLVGVLSGVHSRGRLMDGGATDIIETIAGLPALLGIATAGSDDEARMTASAGR